jgi:hypothetical protein
MPPPPNGAQKTKKKKGHAPAHQNKFAFRHNPKSKLTEKIVSSPNIHVCQRCYDKIEWRKQYRKYKPRTQPGFCNGCQRRNVLSAYHTICTSCTTESSKAKEVISVKQQRLMSPQNVNADELMYHQHVLNDATHMDEKSMVITALIHPIATISKLRVCAVCVKEIALPDEDEQEEKDGLAANVGTIRLRELKTLERKAANQKSSKGTNLQNPLDNGDDECNSNLSDKDNINGHASCWMDDTDDDDDPFLNAIGGGNQPLTGKAYQQELLRRQKQQQ